MREFKKNKVNEYSLQKKTLNLREREKFVFELRKENGLDPFLDFSWI